MNHCSLRLWRYDPAARAWEYVCDVPDASAAAWLYVCRLAEPDARFRVAYGQPRGEPYA